MSCKKEKINLARQCLETSMLCKVSFGYNSVIPYKYIYGTLLHLLLLLFYYIYYFTLLHLLFITYFITMYGTLLHRIFLSCETGHKIWKG